MKNQFKVLPYFIFILAIASCGQNSTQSSTEQNDSTEVKEKLTIEPLQETNDFPNAALTITKVNTTMHEDSVKVTFDFEVSNYELTKQTEDMHAEHAANSAEGQHIHFILDNKPYVALYKPTHTVTLAKDTEHTLLVFLSRSYHLSVKSENASALLKFKIDKNGQYQKLDTPTEPMLFYSRPKGEYKGKDTENVLLDFYVKNLKLSPSDYKVKVEVKDTSFTVDAWSPYLIKGAGTGDLEVKISLIDPQGNNVNGTYGEIERASKLIP